MIKIVILLLILIFVILFFLFLSWITAINHNEPKIQFSTFVHMYRVAPEKWDLDYATPLYKKEIEKSFGSIYTEKIFFRFSFKDYLLYQIFRITDTSIPDKKMAECITSFQKDIDDYRRKNLSNEKQNGKEETCAPKK